jgi:hypothetical protein
MTVSAICKRGEMVGHASLSSFIFGIFEILGMCSILLYLRYSQVLARRGQIDSLVLPIYYIIVLYEIIVGLLVGLDSAVGLYYENVYVRALKWLLFQSASEGIAVLFLHNGVGIRALRNSSICGISWGLVSSLLPVIVYRAAGFSAYCALVITFLVILLIFYLICWLLPQRYMHRRPALVHLARFYVIIITLFLVGYLIALSSENDNNNCVVELTFAVTDFLLPFVVLRALREDSMFWQGLYANAAASNLNQPLMGMWDFNQKTMTMVTDSICTLERKVVTIIPFGNLTLDTSRYFSGGSARVYRGKYKDHTVAIKMLFCIELTPERVIEFCNEASLLHSLQHPYVVTCHGVSVMPPAMCLVTEFCDVGSLYDFLHTEEEPEPGMLKSQKSVSPLSRLESPTDSNRSSRRVVNGDNGIGHILPSNSSRRSLAVITNDDAGSTQGGISRLVSNVSSNSASNNVTSLDFNNSSDLHMNPLLQAARRSTTEGQPFSDGDSNSRQSLSLRQNGDNTNSQSQTNGPLTNSSGNINSNFNDIEGGINADSSAVHRPSTASSNSNNFPTGRQSFSLSGQQTPSSAAPLMERSGSFMREFLGLPELSGASSSFIPSTPSNDKHASGPATPRTNRLSSAAPPASVSAFEMSGILRVCSDVCIFANRNCDRQVA